MNTLVYLNRPQDAAKAGNGSESGLARRALAAFRFWRTRRAVERELRAVPDWARRDIGLETAHIPEVAAAIARKEFETGVAPRHLQEIARSGPLELAGCG